MIVIESNFRSGGEFWGNTSLLGGLSCHGHDRFSNHGADASVDFAKTLHNGIVGFKHEVLNINTTQKMEVVSISAIPNV